jgi:hypothetical protein
MRRTEMQLTPQIIRRTALFFEKSPERYSFFAGKRQRVRGSTEPMCVIAALGTFMRTKALQHYRMGEELGIDYKQIYREVGIAEFALGPTVPPFPAPTAAEVVIGLRAWADRLEASADQPLRDFHGTQNS